MLDGRIFKAITGKNVSAYRSPQEIDQQIVLARPDCKLAKLLNKKK